MMKKYENEVIDVAVKYAGHSALADAALDCAGADACVSEAFDKRMRTLIGRKATLRGASKALKVAARIAAVLAVLIIISTAVIFSSEALRVQVANLIFSPREGSQTTIGFSGADAAQLPEGIVLPGYLPKGFALTEASQSSQAIQSRYEDGSGSFITIEQLALNTQIQVKRDSSREIEIAGRTAYIMDGEEHRVVIFNNDLSSFVMSANIDIAEMLIIAESMLLQ
jgi:hypothetical protein